MGYKTSFKQVKEERIVECNCDTCGVEIFSPEKYGLSQNPFYDTLVTGNSGFILEHTGGFYSKHDCETETLVLCDDCFFELVKEIKSKK